MAGNNFQQWNPNGTNQETDSAYTSDSLRSNGAVNPSIFPSATANKLYYQLSTFVAALAGALATKGYAMSDASLSTLQSTLASIITTTDLAPYATLANPALTGTPTAPTPATADSSTKLATSAFVKAQNYAPLVSPVFSGTPQSVTPAGTDNSVAIATTAFIKALAYATLASPNFAGTPTAPTPATGDSSAALATTAFVKNQGYQAALGFTPVQQGGGSGQYPNKVYIGFNAIDGLNLQIDGNATFGKLICTSMMPGNIASTGYSKLASGIIVQWGHILVQVGATTTFNYPLSFPNACYCVQISQGAAISTTDTTSAMGIDNISQAQFNVTKANAAGPGGSVGAYFFALGS